MEYEHQHCYDDGSESFFRLVYEIYSEEVCSESRTSGTQFTLTEAYLLTDNGEVELPYNKETYEFAGLPSEPEDDDLFESFECDRQLAARWRY